MERFHTHGGARRLIMAAAAALVAAQAAPAAAQSGADVAFAPRIPGADARHPVVLELFQSQGCSSCPPANANLNALADRGDILALSFAVTYWDHLGWKDRFATPAYTARQWDYAHRAGRKEVYTPQIVVNGRAAIVGVRRPELASTLVAAGPAPGRIDARVSGSKLTIAGSGIPEASTVWLVRYDPRVRDVPVKAGENTGKTLPHRNIVRQLVKLGAWRGGGGAFALPAAGEGGLSSAVLVQQGAGGPILAASKL